MDEKEARIEVESKVLGNSVQYGWDIQPDLKKLDAIYKGLVRNLLKHGAMLCPCAVILPSKDNPVNASVNKTLVCPCVKGKADIESKGMCRCRLFFKKKIPAKQD